MSVTVETPDGKKGRVVGFSVDSHTPEYVVLVALMDQPLRVYSPKQLKVVGPVGLGWND